MNSPLFCSARGRERTQTFRAHSKIQIAVLQVGSYARFGALQTENSEMRMWAEQGEKKIRNRTNAPPLFVGRNKKRVRKWFLMINQVKENGFSAFNNRTLTGQWVIFLLCTIFTRHENLNKRSEHHNYFLLACVQCCLLSFYTENPSRSTPPLCRWVCCDAQ